MFLTTRFNTLVLVLAPISATLIGAGGKAVAATDLPILLDEVTVVGYALDLTRSQNPGATVAVITRQQIEEHQYKGLEDALRDVPALSVSSGGTRGSFTQFRLRGAEANHTLVTIDGQPVNMVADSGFDLSSILIDDVDRIEVIKGPQSGLYGAGAHAGVIAITTISGRGLKKPALSASVEAGAPNSRQGSISLAGGSGPFYAAISAGGFFDGSFNASAFGSELDPASNSHGSLRAGVDLNENLNLEGFVRGSRSGLQSDPTDFNCLQYDINFICIVPSPTYGRAIDGNNFTDRHSLAYGLAGTGVFLGGDLVNRAAINRFDETLTFLDTGTEAYHSEGHRTRLEDRASYHLAAGPFTGALSLQVDHESEEFAYRSPFALPFAADGITRSQTGIAGELLGGFAATGTSFSANARYDAYSAYQGTVTWRVAVGQKIGDTELHASVGTGTTKPTFYEQYGIFGGFVGNPNVKLEHSLGWDFGAEQPLFGGAVVVGATLFQTRLQDEIANTGYIFPCGLSFCYSVVNLDGTSRRQGLELTATWHATPALDVRASYAFVDSRDPSGAEEVRRPRNTGGLDIALHPAGSPWSGGVGVSFNGAFLDTRSIPNAPYVDQVAMPAYALVSARAAYELTANVSLTARVENILDAKHEDVFGYPGAGRALYLGAKAKF